MDDGRSGDGGRGHGITGDVSIIEESRRIDGSAASHGAGEG